MGLTEARRYSRAADDAQGKLIKRVADRLDEVMKNEFGEDMGALLIEGSSFGPVCVVSLRFLPKDLDPMQMIRQAIDALDGKPSRGTDGKAASLIRTTPLACQVCVPKEWTDEQIVKFANEENPAGTENGWKIRQLGETTRVTCLDDEKFIHAVLEC